jgi:hypothetical protein
VINRWLGWLAFLFVFAGLAGYVALSIANYAEKKAFPAFELATISAVLGGFLFSSGFTGIAQQNVELMTKIRRIGLTYLISAISFIILTMFIALALKDYSQPWVNGFVLAGNFVSLLGGIISFPWATAELVWIMPQLFATGIRGNQMSNNHDRLSGAFQKYTFAGLEVFAYPTGKRGLYYTDEKIEVTFELANTLPKRLHGEARFFYGFGPSGTEGKTGDIVPFDLNPIGTPGDRDSKLALRRLVAVQGNGIIGWIIEEKERDVIVTDTTEERELKSASASSGYFETLYAFLSYNREFYQKVHARQEELMKSTNSLTKWVIFLAIITLVVGLIQVLVALGVINKVGS